MLNSVEIASFWIDFHRVQAYFTTILLHPWRKRHIRPHRNGFQFLQLHLRTLIIVEVEKGIRAEFTKSVIS